MKASFFGGVGLFFESLREISINAPLRRWYLRSALWTFFIAVTLFCAALSVGAWGLWKSIGQTWVAGMGVTFFVLVLLYVSGTVTLSIMNLMIVIVSGEDRLLKLLRTPDSGTEVLQVQVVSWRIRKNEFFRIFISVLASVLCWPMLLIPFTTPAAIFIYAWVMGAESLATGAKLGAKLGIAEKDLPLRMPLGLSLGIGILPALGALFPIFGWAVLPVLTLSGIRARQKILLNGPEN